MHGTQRVAFTEPYMITSTKFQHMHYIQIKLSQLALQTVW